MQQFLIAKIKEIMFPLYLLNKIIITIFMKEICQSKFVKK